MSAQYEQNLNGFSKKDIITYGIYAIIGIVVLIILIVGLKWLISKIKGDALVKESKESVKTRNLSYDDFEYELMASSIFNAANGAGTDEKAIYRNLKKLKNIDDWKRLISVYNVDEDDFNLVSRLIYELNESEQEEVNKILSKFNASI